MGSTGSIGRQTLAVAAELGIGVRALAAHSSIELLCEQITLFHPALVSVGEAETAQKLTELIGASGLPRQDWPDIVYGRQGLIDVATVSGIDMVVAALVGFIGLEPVLHALERGYDIALANKETLVVGGELVLTRAEAHGCKIFPVDSEHSAIWQCLKASGDGSFRRIFLTASGGPFRSYTADRLEKVSVSQALKHPTWKMGHKITIDSATLMNKGLEIIEACHLFSCEPQNIEVVVHPESIIHSMVEMNDGSVIAQLGFPNMRIPIRLALTWPERIASEAEERFNPFSPAANNLHFYPPDETVFPSLRYAREAFAARGVYPCVLNAANEAAVELFLQQKLTFCDIFAVVSEALESYQGTGEALSFPLLEKVHFETIAKIKQNLS